MSVFRTYDPTARTPTIGLVYSSDATMNANLRQIDAAFAEVRAVIPLPEPPPEAAHLPAAEEPAPTDEA
jgi:hypothetical protein